jgi:hypothetical protein
MVIVISIYHPHESIDLTGQGCYQNNASPDSNESQSPGPLPIALQTVLSLPIDAEPVLVMNAWRKILMLLGTGNSHESNTRLPYGLRYPGYDFNQRSTHTFCI